MIVPLEYSFYFSIVASWNAALYNLCFSFQYNTIPLLWQILFSTRRKKKIYSMTGSHFFFYDWYNNGQGENLLKQIKRKKKKLLTCNITYSSGKLFLTNSSVMEGASIRTSDDRKLSLELATLGLTRYCWIPTTCKEKEKKKLVVTTFSGEAYK